MTIDWTGSATARRIDALEQEIARLRDLVANQPPPEDPRVGRIESIVPDLARRLSALEDRVAADGETIAEQAASAASDATRAETDRRELARLRIEMIRLDRDFTRHQAETRKIVLGLLERIQRASRARLDTNSEPPEPEPPAARPI